MAKITSNKIGYKYIESLVGKVIKKLNQFELKYYTNNFEHLTNTNEDLLSTIGIVGKTCIYDPKEKDIIREKYHKELNDYIEKIKEEAYDKLESIKDKEEEDAKIESDNNTAKANINNYLV